MIESKNLSTFGSKIRLFFKKIVSPRTWTKLFWASLFFLRREGNFIRVHKWRVDISVYIPFVPIAAVILFISLGFMLNGGSISRISGVSFIIWNEAAVASTIDSMDQYTPLIKGKKTPFYQVVQKELEKPTPVITSGATVYLGAQSVARLQGGKTKSSERKGVIDYTVQNGDTVSGVAANFSLKVETLKWANDLADVDTVNPGQVLKIPPVDGVLYTIEEGDTLSGAVSYYGGDYQRTLDVNGITDASTIYVGQKIIIAGGSINETPAPTVTQQEAPASGSSSNPSIDLPQGNFSNNFPYGWCTWYVASRRYVPWNGNAGDWYNNAQGMGYAVGSQPTVGAIMVSNESWWGHVAVVEAVYGSTILISEMNATAGWGQVDYRVLPLGSGSITGFIY